MNAFTVQNPRHKCDWESRMTIHVGVLDCNNDIILRLYLYRVNNCTQYMYLTESYYNILYAFYNLHFSPTNNSIPI